MRVGQRFLKSIFTIKIIQSAEQTYLSHFLPVSFRIQWSFCQENGMFFGSNAELVVESVMPDL